jgi:prevent-host-death family protein
MNDTKYRSEYEIVRVSEDIVPLGEFRTHTARVLRKMRDSGRPVIITQQGRPAAVMLSPEEFDRLQERRQFVAAVTEGLADAAAGRVIDDEELDLPQGRRSKR